MSFINHTCLVTGKTELMQSFLSFRDLLVTAKERRSRLIEEQAASNQKIIQRLSPKMFSLFSNNQVNHFSSQGKNSEKSVEKKS